MAVVKFIYFFIYLGGGGGGGEGGGRGGEGGGRGGGGILIIFNARSLHIGRNQQGEGPEGEVPPSRTKHKRSAVPFNL